MYIFFIKNIKDFLFNFIQYYDYATIQRIKYVYITFKVAKE